MELSMLKPGKYQTNGGALATLCYCLLPSDGEVFIRGYALGVGVQFASGQV